ncbi:MAG: cobalamin biosynthesis protein CbiD [Peptococcaceae bacterium]|nr:cobalamin biosynthesis protein CbiD [Peptococcaceae bacterium]
MSRTQKTLRSGYTTGACAAGAAKAAALLLFQSMPSDHVFLEGPLGDIIDIPIKELSLIGSTARAVVEKDGGDDPDVTHGLDIVVELTLSDSGFNILGGEGVGMVTLPGLPIAVGSPAINPVPQEMIKKAVMPIIRDNCGVTVVISVPGGREAAKSTLNQRLGISGGISILGTSGIVRPMSLDALKESLEPFVKKAAAMGFKRLVLTPGGFGYRQLVEKFGAHPDAVVETSNFIGFMLEKCVENKIEAVILWGQIGKMTKVAGGIFNTHSRVADGRREILAAQAALQGAKKELIEEILNSNTLESAMMHLEKSGLARVIDCIAEKASEKAEEYVWGSLRVGTVITGRSGEILTADGTARELGRLILCRELE